MLPMCAAMTIIPARMTSAMPAGHARMFRNARTATPAPLMFATRALASIFRSIQISA